MSQSATRTRLACLQDAMRPVPPVTARPTETIDPLLFVNSTPEAWNEIMRAKYGPDWEQDT